MAPLRRGWVRDVLLFAPLALSLAVGAAGAQFRRAHPGVPNYDFSAWGGMLAATSILIGLHIVFFERRRPERYRKAWHRFAVAAIAWAGGFVAMAWNLSTAKPWA